jgi:F0F1-type ATP synthase membrane subunit b/b'
VKFAVIVFVRWFFLRKLLACCFANCREEMQKLLKEAIRARDEAEAKGEEYRKKMLNLGKGVGTRNNRNNNQARFPAFRDNFRGQGRR